MSKLQLMYRCAARVRPIAFLLGLAAVLEISGILSPLQRWAYDHALAGAARPGTGEVVIVAIDTASLARQGAWPWPREVHARLIDRLRAAGARVVVHAEPFVGEQSPHALEELHRIAATVAQDPALAHHPELPVVLSVSRDALDGDAQLAQSLAAHGHSLIALGTLDTTSVDPSDQWLDSAPPAAGLPTLRGAATRPSAPSIWPLPRLAQAALGIGHLQLRPDGDGKLRHHALSVEVGARAVASLAWLAAAAQQGLATDAAVAARSARTLGHVRVPTNAAEEIAPIFAPVNAEHGGVSSFARLSAHTVLQGVFNPRVVHDKLVLIGRVEHESRLAGVMLPDGEQLAPVEVLAQISSSLLTGQLVEQPAWARALPWITVLGVAAYLSMGALRLADRSGLALTAAIASLLMLVAHIGLDATHVWASMVLPTAVLVLGHALLLATRRNVHWARWIRAPEGPAVRPSALPRPGSGLAEDPGFSVLSLPPNELTSSSNAMPNASLHEIRGMAVENSRGPASSPAEPERQAHPYHDAVASTSGEPDAPAAPQRAMIPEGSISNDPTQPSTVIPLARAEPEPSDPLRRPVSSDISPPPARALMDQPWSSATQPAAMYRPELGSPASLPRLGPYQLERELGRGAMGRVYLASEVGHGGEVAVKTLALTREFEGFALQEARARFQREALAAGRLQHPDIVRVLLSGEERGLAYIAMERLQGHDLTNHVQTGHLLSLRSVVAIGARVAAALAHAHRHGVIHRDIKPANIMIDPEHGQLKVTDFGIARISDAAKTRTGLVLGSPSYMSPEQLSGRPCDGRSDLYSLGVLLFQLLTGQLPHHGHTLADMIRATTQDPPPDLRGLAPHVPRALADVIDILLQKRPELRYADGDQVAVDLRLVGAMLAKQAQTVRPTVEESATRRAAAAKSRGGQGPKAAQSPP